MQKSAVFRYLGSSPRVHTARGDELKSGPQLGLVKADTGNQAIRLWTRTRNLSNSFDRLRFCLWPNRPLISSLVQGEGLCGGVGEISWIPKVEGESLPKLEVSVAFNIVKSRQVSEVMKSRRRSLARQRVDQKRGRGRHVVEIGQRPPCFRGLEAPP